MDSDRFRRQLPRILAIALLGVNLTSCGETTPAEIDAEIQASSTSSPKIDLHAKALSRNQALADLLRREDAQLLSNWPSDRKVSMEEGVTALQLNSLLLDVSYAAEFVLENNRHRLVSVTIGSAAEAENSDAVSDDSVEAESSFDARLEEADAEERQDLIDDAEMSAENLRVFENELAKAGALWV